jgi:LuxR family maltose regulon positive regulatory protein
MVSIDLSLRSVRGICGDGQDRTGLHEPSSRELRDCRRFWQRWMSMPAGVVLRHGLSDHLSAVPPGGVAVVCAPAGSGKTFLLRSWAASTGERVAWISLPRGEEDAQRFWLTVVEEVRRALGDDGPVEPVSPAPAFAGEAVVTRLLGGLRALAEPLVLVIDDLHELRSQEALDLLELFLGHLPPAVRVVIATRDDARIPLHRLRLAGMVTELRADDLAFSADEARDLLEASGVELSPAGVALLSERTEGWAAGLRLAALSLAGHPDPERFVREFSGSERTVAGYLMAEVLQRQPADVRNLLLRTSVLDRVSGPLADHLTGASGSEAILQRLADANAFVTPLDAGRSWFRYHPLFADLLRLELRRTAPGTIAALHRAAAEWHEQHGDVVEAIRHAQDAGEWWLAGRLLADTWADLMLEGRPGAVRGLLARFRPGVPARDAQLALVAAGARIPDAALEDAGTYLAIAEEGAEDVPSEARPRFDVEVAAVKLALARRRADLPAVLEAADALETALRARPASDQALGSGLRANALMDLGIGEIWASRLPDAQRHLEEALVLMRRLDRRYLEVACLGHLALAKVLSGERMATALELADEALALAGEGGWIEDPVAATAHAVGASVLVSQGRLDEAESRIDRAERTVRPEGEPATELIVHHSRGQLRLAQGRYADALSAFRRADRVQARLAGAAPISIEPRLGAALAQARMGDTGAAQAVLAGIDAEQRNRVEVGAAAAAVAIAAEDFQAAADLLAPVLELAADGDPRWGTVAALLADAVAHDRLGEQRAAEASLERALDAAEPDGILLPFLFMQEHDLLERHPRHRSAHAKLLADILDRLRGGAPAAAGAVLYDDLSEAELRVMRYLPTNLKMSEIAAELFVSNNTVRTHVTHIYRKLGAHSRSEAVARARELGLLAPSSRAR